MHVYDRALIVALRHRRITLGVMIATVAATLYLFVVIPKGFFPQQDTGLIVGISEAAPDVSPDGMKQRQRAILDIASRDPAVASAVGYIGPGGPTVTENDGRVFITLKPEGQRTVTADQVIARLTTAVQQVQGMRLYMQAAQDITIGSRLAKTQYQFTLVDINQDELNFYAQKLLAKLQDRPELTAVASDQEAPGRTLKVEIDRPAAALFGITPATVDNTLYDAFGQRHIARIYTALNEYYVDLEVNPQYQLGPNALQRIYVLSQNSTMVPLSQIARLIPAVTPIVVNHQGQFPSVTSELQSRAGRDDWRGGFSGAESDRGFSACRRRSPRASRATHKPSKARSAPRPPDPRSVVRGLYYPWHALREYDSPVHDLIDAAFGGSRRAHHSHAGRPPARRDRHNRHYPSDRHREEDGIMLVDVALEEQRDHGLSSEDAIHHACLLRSSSNSDDDHVRAVRRRSVDARNRNRVGNPTAAGLCDRRRFAGVSSTHALHHAGRIHLHGQDQSGPVGSGPRQAAPYQRGAHRVSDEREMCCEVG